MGSGVQCIKYLLFIFNLIIALCGLGLIVIGCLFIFGLTDDVVNWIEIDVVAEILQNDFIRSAVYIIIAAGGLVFLIAVCGCLGAILSSKCLLGLYFFFLMIIFAAQLAAGILAAIYSDEATNYLSNEGMEFIQYGYDETAEEKSLNRTITEAWNQVQTTFECCGIQSAQDYTDANKDVPNSCCTEMVLADNADMCSVTTVHGTGCQEILEDLVEEYETILAAAAVGTACIELFCMLFAICLCRNVGDDDD